MTQTEDTLVSQPETPRPERGPRFSRRTVVLLLVAAAVVAAAVAVYETGVLGGGGKTGGGANDNSFPTGVTHITRQVITSQTEVSATLTYAGAATVVVPAGTAPTDVLQAQQQVTGDEGMLHTAESTLSSDAAALAQLEANLAAAKAAQAVECAGANAAEAASSPSGNGSGGNGGGGTCSNDAQTVASDQTSLTADQAKVAQDRSQIATDETSLSTAQTALAADGSSAALFGQNSTYTTLPAIGKILHRGQKLYGISGNPVYLMYGRQAAWRAFVPGMSPGTDVEELNANLDALGYGKGLRGKAFTSATAAAIDAFQTAHGAKPTGKLLLGAVVFEPGAVRITSVTPTVGSTVQPGPVLTVTLTQRQVQIQLDSALESDVKVGDPVTITLPSNATTPGRVSYVGTVATTPSNNGNSGSGNGGSSSPTIEVNVTPTDPAATGTLDQVPVNVSITEANAGNVLAVPVEALLALSSGGYAVEEIGAGGVHHLVGVSLGAFDDQTGMVQVSGPGLAAGQRVVTPSL